MVDAGLREKERTENMGQRLKKKKSSRRRLSPIAFLPAQPELVFWQL